MRSAVQCRARRGTDLGSAEAPWDREAMAAYLRMYQKVGWEGLWKHLFTFRSIKEGTLVGTDALGNKYYENTAYPWGQHRWVEPPTCVRARVGLRARRRLS